MGRGEQYHRRTSWLESRRGKGIADPSTSLLAMKENSGDQRMEGGEQQPNNEPI